MTKRSIHATDFADAESGVMDFSRFRVQTDGAIAVVGEREFKDTQELNAFMQDMVVIELHVSTDRNAPTHALVGVNGEQVWLPRGQKIRIPRYFVERLARSRPHMYASVRDPNPDAEQGYVNRKSVGMDYGFSVLNDPSPKGRSWLERVVRESA